MFRLRPGRGERNLVGREELHGRERAGDDGDRHSACACGEQHAHECDVQQAEQEHGQEHARLEAAVTPHAGSGALHGSILANTTRGAATSAACGSGGVAVAVADATVD